MTIYNLIVEMYGIVEENINCSSDTVKGVLTDNIKEYLDENELEQYKENISSDMSIDELIDEVNTVMENSGIEFKLYQEIF